MNWIKANSKVAWLLAAFTLIALAVAFSDYFLWFDLSAADKVNSIVLLTTAAAIIIYTQETYELKGIQQKQFDYDNRPYFRIMFSNNPQEIFEIKNQGKGIAVDITFEPVTLRAGPVRTPVIIKRRPSIGPNSPSGVTIDEIREQSGKDKKFNLKGYIDAEMKSGKFPILHMVYMDLMGQVYDAKFEPDERYNDRFKILEQKKR